MWIEAKKPDQKHGDRMLKELCGLADKLGVTLTLQAAPLEEPKLGDLIDWYDAQRLNLQGVADTLNRQRSSAVRAKQSIQERLRAIGAGELVDH